MAGLTGIRAIAGEQPNGAVTAGAHEDRSMPAEACSDPLNPKLPPIAVLDDLDAPVRQPHVPQLWITERVGIDIGAIIARDGIAQIGNADCRHQFDCRPWLRISWTTALSGRALYLA